MSIHYGIIEEVEEKTDKSTIYFEEIIEESKDVDEEYEMLQVEALDECTFEEGSIIAEEVDVSFERGSKERRLAPPPIDPEGKNVV